MERALSPTDKLTTLDPEYVNSEDPVIRIRSFVFQTIEMLQTNQHLKPDKYPLYLEQHLVATENRTNWILKNCPEAELVDPSEALISIYTHDIGKIFSEKNTIFPALKLEKIWYFWQAWKRTLLKGSTLQISDIEPEAIIFLKHL